MILTGALDSNDASSGTASRNVLQAANQSVQRSTSIRGRPPPMTPANSKAKSSEQDSPLKAESTSQFNGLNAVHLVNKGDEDVVDDSDEEDAFSQITKQMPKPVVKSAIAARGAGSSNQ